MECTVGTTVRSLAVTGYANLIVQRVTFLRIYYSPPASRSLHPLFAPPLLPSTHPDLRIFPSFFPLCVSFPSSAKENSSGVLDASPPPGARPELHRTLQTFFLPSSFPPLSVRFVAPQGKGELMKEMRFSLLLSLPLPLPLPPLCPRVL